LPTGASCSNTGKTYSPLFVKTFASNHKLPTSYKSIKKRRDRRLTAKITKPATLVLQKNKMATNLAAIPGQGIENQPPDVPFRMNLNTRIKCKDCNRDPPNIVEEASELICGDCGLVLKDRLISSESEWRTFNSDDSRGDDPNRVGEADNDLLTGSNIGTQIGGGYGSGQTRKLQMAQSKLQGNKEDSKLNEAYQRLSDWANVLKIPPATTKQAKAYYHSIYNTSAFRGKNSDSLLAACLFIATRQHKNPRSFAEIFGATSVPKKEVGRMYKLAEMALKQRGEQALAAQADTGAHSTSRPVRYLCTRKSWQGK
jgi:transcription initiation factor TFIIB